jgi:hypothetical protein
MGIKKVIIIMKFPVIAQAVDFILVAIWGSHISKDGNSNYLRRNE